MNPLDIIHATAEEFDISTIEFLSNNRARRCSDPRQIAMYMCRKFTDYTLKEIGMLFNRRHSTVHYSINAVQCYIETDRTMRNHYENIISKLSQK